MRQQQAQVGVGRFSDQGQVDEVLNLVKEVLEARES